MPDHVDGEEGRTAVGEQPHAAAVRAHARAAAAHGPLALLRARAEEERLVGVVVLRAAQRARQ